MTEFAMGFTLKAVSVWLCDRKRSCDVDKEPWIGIRIGRYSVNTKTAEY